MVALPFYTLAANESRTNLSPPPLPTGKPNAPSLAPCTMATPAQLAEATLAVALTNFA